MKKVAITGGLSSGKSSVCKLLQDRGAYVVSADEIVHELLSPKSPICKEIVDLLGKDILTSNELDREKIAKKIFNDKKLLKTLENLLHPKVLNEIEKQYRQVKNQGKYSLFVAEVPLLYEIESEHLFDTVVAVISDQDIASLRFQEKTKKPHEEFELRMTHQRPPEEKAAKADMTIVNNKKISDLEKQVETLYQNLI